MYNSLGDCKYVYGHGSGQSEVFVCHNGKDDKYSLTMVFFEEQVTFHISTQINFEYEVVMTCVSIGKQN